MSVHEDRVAAELRLARRWVTTRRNGAAREGVTYRFEAGRGVDVETGYVELVRVSGAVDGAGVYVASGPVEVEAPSVTLTVGYWEPGGGRSQPLARTILEMLTARLRAAGIQVVRGQEFQVE